MLDPGRPGGRSERRAVVAHPAVRACGPRPRGRSAAAAGQRRPSGRVPRSSRPYAPAERACACDDRRFPRAGRIPGRLASGPRPPRAQPAGRDRGPRGRARSGPSARSCRGPSSPQACRCSATRSSAASPRRCSGVLRRLSPSWRQSRRRDLSARSTGGDRPSSNSAGTVSDRSPGRARVPSPNRSSAIWSPASVRCSARNERRWNGVSPSSRIAAPVLARGIALVVLPAVARVAGREPGHHPVADDLGHDRRTRDRVDLRVAVDDVRVRPDVRLEARRSCCRRRARDRGRRGGRSRGASPDAWRGRCSAGRSRGRTRPRRRRRRPARG